MKTKPYTDAYIVEYPNGDQTLERNTSKYPASIKVVTHTVLAGETLSNIAFKYYGDSSYWMYIADYNSIYNPLFDLKPGDVLNIPL